MNSNENQLMTTSRRFPGCFTNILLISMNTSGTFAFFQKLALHRGFDFALSTASVIQGDRTKDPHTRRTMTNCSQMTNWKMKITVSLRSLIKNQEWYVVMDKSDKQRNRVWTSMSWKTQNKRKTSQAFPPATAEGKGVNCHCIMNLVPAVAGTVIQNGSRLTHLCGLPKPDKWQLVMRPILSATKAYNYELAKWLDEKLRLL